MHDALLAYFIRPAHLYRYIARILLRVKWFSDSIAAVVAHEQKLSDDDMKHLIQILLSPHKHKHRLAKKDENVPEWKKFVPGGKGLSSCWNSLSIAQF